MEQWNSEYVYERENVALCVVKSSLKIQLFYLQQIESRFLTPKTQKLKYILANVNICSKKNM